MKDREENLCASVPKKIRLSSSLQYNCKRISICKTCSTQITITQNEEKLFICYHVW